MSDNSPFNLFRNSIRKIARKETNHSIFNDEHKGLNQKKSLLLKKADLNLQNVLSTILVNCDDEDKNNYNINGTLKQIQNIKKNISFYYSSSSDDESDISPATRKNRFSIGSPLNKFNLSKIKQTKSLGLKDKTISFDTVTNFTSSVKLLEMTKKKQSSGFVTKQSSGFVTQQSGKNTKIPIESSDEDDTNLKNDLHLSVNAIKNLNKIREDIYDTINLSPKKTRDSVHKETQLHKEDFAEDDNTDSSLPLSAPDNEESQLNSQCTNGSFYRSLLKKNKVIYDSLSEEETLEEYFYIMPNSSFSFTFDTVLAISYLVSFIHLPFAIAFIHNTSPVILFFNFVFNTFIDLLFLIDIILSFFKAYYDLEEHFIFKNNDICFHYFKGWLLFDIISTIPFNFLLDYILVFHPKNRMTQSTLNIYSDDLTTLVHLLRLLRLFKFFKIIFDNSFMKYLQKAVFDSMMESKWALINISLLLFFAFVNLFGCIFVFLGFNHYPNWFEVKGLEPSDVFDIYIASIYFILMTIVSIGYGDITAANMVERVFNVFLLIFGIMVYSWAISAISNQIEDTSIKAIEYKQKVQLLENIKLSHKKFPNALNEKIQRYLYHNYEHEQSNVEIILDQLPWILKNALIYQMYRPILEHFIFFKNFSNDDFCVRVLMAFIPIIYLKNERIIHEGDYLEEMLFVKKGILTLELLIPSVLNEELEKTLTLSRALTSTITPIEFDAKKVLSPFSYRNGMKFNKEKPKLIFTGYEDKYVKLINLRKNEHFGDIMMFLNQRCPLSVRVKTKKAEAFLLKKTDVIDISMNYPKIWRKIIRKSIFNFEQINCLIRKTLRFFFLQNKICFNQLAKKFNCLNMHNTQTQFYNAKQTLYDATNFNCDLASIPSMNSNQSFDTQYIDNRHKDDKITRMLKPEDEESNVKLSESSSANLISQHAHEPQNDIISEENKPKLKSILHFSENSSRKSNLQRKPTSAFKGQQEEAKSIKLEDSYRLDFSLADTYSKDESFNKNKTIEKKENEINNELMENESLYPSHKYVFNEIDWDNYYDNSIIKEIFNQKPESVKLSQFKSIPTFKVLQCDKGEDYEYTPSNVYYTFVNNPTNNSEERLSPDVHSFKIAINVISTLVQENKDLQIPLMDNRNILRWNNTLSCAPSKEDKSNCLSSRSNKSLKSARGDLSNRSGRSERKNSKENCLISNRQDYSENEGLERIMTSKHNTVNIFRKKTRRGTGKEVGFKDIPSTGNNMKSNSSLLQVIGENIHSNAMNLNNPASFYSSAFASMIDQQKTKGDLLQINKRINNLISLMKQNG